MRTLSMIFVDVSATYSASLVLLDRAEDARFLVIGKAETSITKGQETSSARVVAIRERIRG
jgi:hypothetical protein